MLKKSSYIVLPVLPLRNIVVFPHMVVPLLVGRDKSVEALEEVMQDDSRNILLVTQKDANTDNPGPSDIHEVGTLGTVLQLLKLPDGTVKVLVEAVQRVRINKFMDNDAYFEAEASVLEETGEEDSEHQALLRAVVEQFEQYAKLNQKIPGEIVDSIAELEESSKLVDAIATHVTLKISEKQELLETLDITERLEKLYAHLESEIDVYKVERKIRNRVKKQMEKTQRDYYLNEQLKAIQRELNDNEDEDEDDIKVLERRIEEVKLSAEAEKKAKSELKKLKNMSQMSAEAAVIRGYIEWLLDVPWSKRSRTKSDLKKAEKVLDKGHHGLEKVKERMVEYLAVQSRQKKIKGPILCFVGPPGVGKTSLGKSIAEAVGRKFVRLSLGGVRDEAEIRGHRRTYVGAMPGKIIQAMKKAGTTNPLIMLDEIDKLGNDWRGDPSSALLEVLDPEQNNAFNDHYMEVDYDLSDVLFVMTSNSLNIPRPLLDRMEVIRIPGYTEDEKLQIAKKHLLPKQTKDHGLKKKEWSISDETLRNVVQRYTKEAGVRNLERELAKLARKSVKKIMMDDTEKVTVTKKNLKDFLGVPKYKFGESEKESLVGVTTGLAWTEVGGELLLIEAVVVPGKGQITSSGKLGDVMKESITAAENLVKSRCTDFGIKPTIFKKKNIHVHLPEGAVPKDGPSAGIGMVTTIVSVLTDIKVKKDVAMTGEVSLRGRAMEIGGLKEKLLAALRGGIKTVLIPKDNEKDLEDIPDNVKKGLKIIPVTTIDEVLDLALEEPVKPIEWVEPDDDDVALSAVDEDDDPTYVTH